MGREVGLGRAFLAVLKSTSPPLEEQRRQELLLHPDTQIRQALLEDVNVTKQVKAQYNSQSNT